MNERYRLKGSKGITYRDEKILFQTLFVIRQ